MRAVFVEGRLTGSGGGNGLANKRVTSCKNMFRLYLRIIRIVVKRSKCIQKIFGSFRPLFAFSGIFKEQRNPLDCYTANKKCVTLGPTGFFAVALNLFVFSRAGGMVNLMASFWRDSSTLHICLFHVVREVLMKLIAHQLKAKKKNAHTAIFHYYKRYL